MRTMKITIETGDVVHDDDNTDENMTRRRQSLISRAAPIQSTLLGPFNLSRYYSFFSKSTFLSWISLFPSGTPSISPFDYS